MAVPQKDQLEVNRSVWTTGGYFFFISWYILTALRIKPATEIMIPIVCISSLYVIILPPPFFKEAKKVLRLQSE